MNEKKNVIFIGKLLRSFFSLEFNYDGHFFSTGMFIFNFEVRFICAQFSFPIRNKGPIVFKRFNTPHKTPLPFPVRLVYTTGNVRKRVLSEKSQTKIMSCVCVSVKYPNKLRFLANDFIPEKLIHQSYNVIVRGDN